MSIKTYFYVYLMGISSLTYRKFKISEYPKLFDVLKNDPMHWILDKPCEQKNQTN